MQDRVVVTWEGQSGKQYKYLSFPSGTVFSDEKPANYIFAAKKAKGVWVPAYIGQTDNINNRMRCHEKAGPARKSNALYIHVHLSGAEEKRTAEEQDLIAKWNPKLNEQPATKASR
jgi:hypothetical protein